MHLKRGLCDKTSPDPIYGAGDPGGLDVSRATVGDCLDLVADYELDDVVSSEVPGGPAADDQAVSEHCETVRNLLNLLQVMGDEQDACATCSHVPGEFEEHDGVVLR